MSDDLYPEPAALQSPAQGGLWRVTALGLVLIGIVVFYILYAEHIPLDWVILFLCALAAVGVLAIFAYVAGLLHVSSGAEARTMSRSVIDSAVRGIVVTNAQGAIIYANDYYGRLSSQASPGAPVGVARLFSHQPESAEAIYRLTRAAKDGRNAAEDIRLTNDFSGKPFAADGSGPIARWFRIHVRELPKSDDSTEDLMVWTVEDITGDRARQENIYLELQRAIDYLDHAPAGFFSADSTGRIQYINSTLADWLGYDLADFEPGDLTLRQIVQGDGANLLMSGGAEGEIRTDVIDLDLVDRKGRAFPVRMLNRAARLADGDLGETRTLVLDRNRGPADESAGMAAAIRFSRFFNDTPFAIATLDASGKVLQTNAPFARVFGIEDGSRSLENLRLSELIAEGRHDAFDAAIKSVLDNKAEIEPVDADLAVDAERGVQLFFTPSEATEGSDERVIVYALDTTEQRRLEAQFAQGQKMQAVGQLAGGVAHDFNNVLTAIIGFSDLLLLKHKSTDPSFNDIMSIKQSANRAAGLVRQLLAFSRRQTLRPQVLDMNNVVGDLTALLRRLIGQNVSLDVDVAGDVWPVRADQVQLEQVVINLVVNARDAMPDGGEITLRTRNVWAQEAGQMNYKGMPAADYVLIEVEDTGTGMPPEVVEKIFEPFFSTKELGKGTGLGLSMVYGIVKQTEGFICPETEVGKGTTFRIFLPRHVPSEQELAVLQGSEQQVRDLTGNERILLVEDEEAVRAFSARALSTTGYEVFEAGSGEEALEVLDEIEDEVDLIISDVVMPEMDGPTLLTHVRERLPDIKFIFVSGYAEESVRQDLADNRSVEFLPKPYTLDQINSKVKEVLSGVSE
ncbi:MAG: response regulator [Hyphomicrobiaceae bacterium]|nr:response regulator [Hyphomicrobiaceae bacterium]